MLLFKGFKTNEEFIAIIYNTKLWYRKYIVKRKI